MADHASHMAEYELRAGSKVTLDVVIGDAASGNVAVSLDREELYSGRSRKQIKVGREPSLRGKVLQAVAVASRVVPESNRVSVTLTLRGGHKTEKISLWEAVDDGSDVELLARVMFT
ncbi:MAG: hypothetical protein QGH45_07555 [Myxococcota bacterium]|jgi:hypothetical protein|nr:hypothetical protein [Myxococcota bacterium]